MHSNNEPFNKQGNRHGLWILYWSDGSLLSITNYVNGERCGLREACNRYSTYKQKFYYAK